MWVGRGRCRVVVVSSVVKVVRVVVEHEDGQTQQQGHVGEVDLDRRDLLIVAIEFGRIAVQGGEDCVHAVLEHKVQDCAGREAVGGKVGANEVGDAGNLRRAAA